MMRNVFIAFPLACMLATAGCKRASPDPASARISNCLANAGAIKVKVLRDKYEVAQRGSELFSKCVQVLNKSIAEDPLGEARQRPGTPIAIVDNNGRICVDGFLYFREVVLGGKTYRGDGALIEKLFEDEVSRRIYFYPSGAKRADGIHSDERKQGRWVYYYETGQRESEGLYDGGKKIGTWTTWDTDGKVLKVEHFGSATTQPPRSGME